MQSELKGATTVLGIAAALLVPLTIVTACGDRRPPNDRVAVADATAEFVPPTSCESDFSKYDPIRYPGGGESSELPRFVELANSGDGKAAEEVFLHLAWGGQDIALVAKCYARLAALNSSKVVDRLRFYDLLIGELSANYISGDYRKEHWPEQIFWYGKLRDELSSQRLTDKEQSQVRELLEDERENVEICLD